MRPRALADHRDRALALGVEVDKRPPLRLGAPRRLNPNPEDLQLSLRAMAEVVVAKRGEEEALAGQARELHRGHGSAACRLLPVLEDLNDLAGFRDALDPRELGPFHVPDDSDSHRAG